MDRERHVIARRGRIRVRPRRTDRRTLASSRRNGRATGHPLAANGGAAIIIDYGYAGGEQGDTLQAVRGHRFAYLLDHPGEQDLTAHVDFAALAEAARRGGATASRIVSQGTWLEDAWDRRAGDGLGGQESSRIRKA